MTKGNRLTMQGDAKFEYDARGNLIKESRGKGGRLVTQFEYNLNNQLTRVHKNNQTIEYRYDPLGRRISKQDTFGETKYLWAENQMVQESRKEIKKTYLFEPHSFKPVALVENGNVYHYHLDHLGTPRELTNSDGKIVWKVRYKTYGNVAVKETDEIENNLRFQGQYFDEETGLHYNRHRYYNPNSGQFITQDPIGLLGGVNNYQYAPNPVGWVDPLGLKCKETFYSVQSSEDVERLANGGEPWPEGLKRANMGPGLYAWDNKADAEKYLSLLQSHGASELKIVAYEIDKKELDKLRKKDLTEVDGDEVDSFMEKHSHYGKAEPHNYQYIKRNVAIGGSEHYFSPDAFKLMKPVS